MSSEQNKSIARLLVGAMSLDGELSKQEQQKVVAVLKDKGMSELIADFGLAIDEDHGDFDQFQECKNLVALVGENIDQVGSLAFRMILDVVASDRYVSLQEASYMSALSRGLKVPLERAQKLFKSVMTSRRAYLEIAGSGIDELIHPQLKKLLSFEGAEDLVGYPQEDSLDEMLHMAKERAGSESKHTKEELTRALSMLGLGSTATLRDAEDVWRREIQSSNLLEMCDLGETFVTAGINKLQRVNDAYKIVLQFFEHLEQVREANRKIDDLERQKRISTGPNTRNSLTGEIEDRLTGIGTEVSDSSGLKEFIPNIGGFESSD